MKPAAPPLAAVRVDSAETVAHLHALAFARRAGLSPERLDGVPVILDGDLPLRSYALVPVGWGEDRPLEIVCVRR